MPQGAIATTRSIPCRAGGRQDGFTVDRALLFALMRQESLFVPQVVSSAGAQGLMQLMPATARFMAERKGMTLSEPGSAAQEQRALADPELNLTLAQEYVRMLLDEPQIKDNLVLFALAYNRGPTATRRWQSLAAQYQHDPLLFLESVPSQESRDFTEHVLTNYWVYRQRLGQPTPDLDALAAGKWPTYTALDRRPHAGWPLCRRIDETRPFLPVNIAVLTVSDTRSEADDTFGRDAGRS